MRRSVGWVLVVGGVVLSGCGDDDLQESDWVETGPVECAMLTLPETAHPEQVEIVTANANLLVLEMVCPEGGRTTLGYTASGASLSVIEEDEEMRFERR